MARGKKTGGRNFKKGNRGRPKGAKDKVPRTFKASIKNIYERLAIDEPALYENAIRRDLKSKRGSVAFQHTQLAAYYLDGKPAETVKVQPDLSNLTVEELDVLERLRLKMDRKKSE
jgi:hypothetical protein